MQSLNSWASAVADVVGQLGTNPFASSSTPTKKQQGGVKITRYYRCWELILSWGSPHTRKSLGDVVSPSTKLPEGIPQNHGVLLSSKYRVLALLDLGFP